MLEQFLVPTLKPGDVVILDNLGSHRAKAIRRAIRDVGARLVFLTQILPDLNPIEQVFAKFKTLLRKAEARTYDAVVDASAAILAQYPPEECAAYVKKRRIRVKPNADRSPGAPTARAHALGARMTTKFAASRLLAIRSATIDAIWASARQRFPSGPLERHHFSSLRVSLRS